MKYTEEDIRKAFQAGMNKGAHQSYYDAPLDENEFVEELNQSKNSEKDIFENREKIAEEARGLITMALENCACRDYYKGSIGRDAYGDYIEKLTNGIIRSIKINK
tara:strand:+ start:1581 stop:1895 length:315 start_codon:yes stop_codon:yes gene_type:complete